MIGRHKSTTEAQHRAKPAASAEAWRELGKEFRQLNDQESKARPAPRAKDALLWACGIYQKDLESLQTKRIELTEEEKRLRYQFKSGAPDPKRSNRHSRSRKHPLPDGWRLNGETSADFEAQFRALAKRAGNARGCPNGADPIDFWLGQLHRELLKHRSKHLFSRHLFGGSRDVILGVCEASATFCSLLEEQAPEQSHRTNKIVDGAKIESSSQKPIMMTTLSRLGAKKQDLSNYLNSPALTEQQHACLSLKLEYGLGVTEIGRRMNIHHSTVQEHIDAGSKTLQREQGQERRKKRRAIDPSSQDEL